ncbi:hypothetical protein EYF80_001870 [Liparis tanakae]|uniref:Uncharacterized protein n=1 Tax=Liparis tanakae TaxID=230148 RepID=A0A4Z2JCH0_9TELE|nr:hypothetical protein EYF80_001870 [Liparis tanakae]
MLKQKRTRVIEATRRGARRSLSLTADIRDARMVSSPMSHISCLGSSLLHKQQQLHHWRANHPGSSRTLRKSQSTPVLGCAALLK